MGYLYSGAFVAIGVYLIYYAVKEFRFLLLPAIYFVLLGAWWAINEFTPQVDLLGGFYAWIVRAVSAVVLIVTGIIYYFKYKRNN